MGATRNTGYIENLIAYDGSNNIGIGGAVNVLYKVTMGGNTLISGNLNVTGTITFSSNVTANSFVKNGGVATEFLKADGTVDSSTYATVTYVNTSITNLVNAAPAALDTLNELATALGNDANFSTTVTTALGNRLRIDVNTQNLTATQKGYGRTNLGVVIGTDVQAWDADLDAIAALTGTSGFLKKTAANTWTLDTNTYQPTLTNPVTGTGSSSQISVFTGTSTIGGDSAFIWSNPAMTIGLSATSNQTDYKLLIQRHGTLANPGTWTDSNGLQIVDYAADGPAAGFIATGLVSIELPRISTTDTYAGNAVAFRIANDNLTIMAVKGNGNTHLGQNGSSDTGERLQVNGAGKFSGALSGTSATFSTEVTSSGSQGRFGGWSTGAGYQGAALEAGVSGGTALLIGYNRTTSVYIPLTIGGNTNQTTTIGGNTIVLQNNGVTALTIASTGAATFNSSVTTGGNILASSSSSDISLKAAVVGDYFPRIYLQRSGGTTKTNYQWSFDIGSNGNLFIENVTGGTDALIFSSTNAATFSSTIQIPSNTWILSNNLNLIRDSYFGYSTSYRVVQVGSNGATKALSLGVDLTGNASGNFSGYEIIIPNNKGIIAPNAANNNYVGVIKVTSSDGINIGGDYTVNGWLQFTNAGAASFSSSVQTGGNITILKGTGNAYLTMQSPIDSNIIFMKYNTTARWYIGHGIGGVDDSNFQIYNGAGQRALTINQSTNYVGINTVSPGKLFTVNTPADSGNGIGVYKNGQLTSYLGDGGSSVAVGILQMYDNSSTETVRIYTGGNSWFTGGHLGVGQSSPSARLHVTTAGITAAAPSLGWPVYNSESDNSAKQIIFDTAGNGSVSTAGYGATVCLVLGQYYDSRVVITASGSGGASPGDQGQGRGKDLMLKAGTSDNGNGFKGGRLYLNGGMGYSASGYNANGGDIIMQGITGSGNVVIGTGSAFAQGLTIYQDGSDSRTLLQLDRPNNPGLQTAIKFSVSNIMVCKITHEYVASNHNDMSFTLRAVNGADIIPLWLCNSGNVLIGYTSDNSNGKLQVNGTIYASGDVVAYSDISVKNNIRPIENVLSRITESRGILYDRIDNGEKNNIGFIAQELEQQFPELIQTNKDSTKGVKYQNAVAVLFEAIKEQQKQIEELKSQIKNK